MPRTAKPRHVGAKEALKILEESYAYYAPAHVFVPGQRESVEYYEYCAAS
ncbi:hypothetical protein EV663_10281 [Rhodovulum bhavnagarense]|uniref:Uncharacterized protein n=1 Tax=Rhodovulum bhavnagarense TaxID=992286 RepID=A0A4R2RJA7_9RHOB|nr:hypothetical protein [Rhodovulum bhavnagarense]TCP62237.1 hypothetical protein EV663_10281 [Rhodovulum bhavnagarense]